MRDHCPPVYDQLTLGSCTANAIGAAFQFDELKEKMPHAFQPSRLFIYYNERVLEGTVNKDSGAQIRDGIKSINVTGVCPEEVWPYDIDKFAVPPPTAAYVDSNAHHSLAYKRVSQELSQLKQCLISGYPFVFGMEVFASFESDYVARTGLVPMPQATEECLGGHAVMCVGFDDAKKMFIVRNSWGTTWGDNGYFHLPYDYMTSSALVSDIWTVTKVC
jgi:C1A family cysteine protease